MAYQHCIARLTQAAGRQLSDDEVRRIFERIHKAALDLKAGRASSAKPSQMGQAIDGVIQAAAREASQQLMHEAAKAQQRAHLQLTKLASRIGEVDAMTAKGVPHLDAVERVLARNYDGRVNVESLEQRVAGQVADLKRRLMATWKALGDDWLGFFQDREKLVTLVRELRGEDTGDAVAKQGAKAFHDAAEEGRTRFNQAGGDIGRLDDWGMPQHHSQEKVALAGREKWVDSTLPLLDRSRYTDDAGVAWSEQRLREFLGKAWEAIATNGHATREVGAKGAGSRASRHAEHRQIHFRDAESTIAYWEAFGERTVPEILLGHVETMARDIAFIEHLGPNPNMTYQTLRDLALQKASGADPVKTPSLEGRARKLDILYDYASGRVLPTLNRNLSKVADGIAHINVASKLGGAALASLFGDKPMMEAVRHLNNLPAIQSWRTELSLLNPVNGADRRLLQRQGLMLDSVRSGLARFYEGLGEVGFTGKLANGVMRITGMTAINDIRKGAFGASLMDGIGAEISAGRAFKDLDATDMRTLKTYGIKETDWNVWRLAQLDDLGSGKRTALTPEGIARITDDELFRAGLAAQGDAKDAAKVRNDAIVKLLGAVNTETEFAVVTPGWTERAAFYGDLQRGSVKGEITRSILQFKSFPWAVFHRMFDAVANKESGASKAAMTAYLVTATTLAGAMLLQTREMLAGRDPLAMADENAWKFWGKAFLQGGALGIYGDFLYSVNQTRYGSGPLETLAGPTIGPLLELGLVQPGQAIVKKMKGEETHFLAQTVQDLKGFAPTANIWYLKAALDHLVFQNVMEAMSPGYLAAMRAKTMRDFNQDWWWQPGEKLPERAPDLGAAVRR